MNFQCQLMIDPVIAADGFTYEREAIELWLQGHDTSPRTPWQRCSQCLLKS